VLCGWLVVRSADAYIATMVPLYLRRVTDMHDCPQRSSRAVRPGSVTGR
jgi:hypothetical protein